MATNGDTPSAGPRSGSPTGSPRSASISLQAAATMNAGLQHEQSRQSSTSSSTWNHRSSSSAGRRRSVVMMNLQLNDPSVPGPGQMVHEPSGLSGSSPQPLSGSPPTADPHHHRAPSLGELHQELEAEQESHVNRLLQMIRQQQLELQRLHSQHGQADDSSAVSERSGHGTPLPLASQQSGPPPTAPHTGSYSRSPVSPHPRSSFDTARVDLQRRSRTPSHGPSSRIRSTSISAESGEWGLGGRDESAFYQAETQMLTRENQMLRHRIRELEKQLTELASGSSAPADPPVPSHLSRSSTRADEDAEPTDSSRAV